MPPEASQTPDDATHARQLQLLIEGVLDYAVYMFDRQGRISSWNAGAQKIYRYSAAEAIGLPFAQLFTPEDQRDGLPKEVLATASRQGRHENEGWRLRKDGSRFWALALVEVLRDTKGAVTGFASITRDMTERRAAQDALVESERRFRLLAEGLVDYAIYMLDASGLITNWNASAQRIHGYVTDEILGHPFSCLFTVEDRTTGAPAGALEIAVREGKYETEGWRLRKDGSRFWGQVLIEPVRAEDGALIGFASIMRDITERRQAHEALRESERQFRLLVNGVTDYALYMLDLNGIVISWNKGAEKIKGYSVEEIIGQHFSRFYAEPDRAAGAPTRALLAARTEGRYEAEGWRVRKDGSLFWAHSILEAVRDERGALVGFAKITRDITERRQAQQALEETQAQLAHRQKMEALGQLTGGIAHDFNNLLMIVNGHMKVLKKLVAEHPKGMQAAAAIEYASKRGTTLVRQMLSFSRRQQLNPEVVDPRECLSHFSAILSTSLPSSVQLVTTAADDVWAIEVDVSELELAVANLVLNARDALPDGGVITLRIVNTQLETDQAPKNLAGEYVTLEIADNGLGIPEDVLPKVCDPFFTTKTPDKGTGLGLSQAYGFAQQAGGSLHINSRLGEGTSVTIYLPRAGAHPKPAATPDEAPQALDPGTVLIVEDNPDVAAVTASFIEQLGYKNRVVSSAEAALRTLENDDEVSIVLTDIVMPGPMDGFALAQAVRERYRHVLVLLVTGYNKHDVQREFPVLHKPYDVSELGRALFQLVAARSASVNDPKIVPFPRAHNRSGPPL